MSFKELQLQKAQQAIDELLMAANSDETLKKQLQATTSLESFVKIAARHGYDLAVADIETLHRRVQEQVQLNPDESDDDELSEQELELVAGGAGIRNTKNLCPPAGMGMPNFRPDDSIGKKLNSIAITGIWNHKKV